MTREQLILSDAYIEATIECIAQSRIPIRLIRKELSDFFIKYRKELLELNLNKQGIDAVEFGIWLNGKDYQSTPHFNKMRSVRQNEGKPVEISELYKLFKIETVQSQQRAMSKCVQQSARTIRGRRGI